MNNSIDKLTLSIIVFLTVVVLGSFAVIEYQCMFIRDECANNQIELKKASEKMEKLSNQASDPDGKKLLIKQSRLNRWSYIQKDSTVDMTADMDLDILTVMMGDHIAQKFQNQIQNSEAGGGK